MTVLHVFDMDGTLLRGSTASLQIAAALGALDPLVALERRFALGELDTRGFARELRSLWTGLTPAHVTAAFAGSPWLHGIREVCEDIRARGERSAVVTMSPDFFARGLLDLGFDEVIASAYPPLPFAVDVDPAAILTPADKVTVVDGLLGRFEATRCVAYGDSVSDAPLFRHLSATVAVNADTHLTGLASASYRGDSCIAAYEIGRGLLASAP
ncbi:HAD family hydrolase [Dactylosporangium sp. NPDC048998]|uniref:HAD family hydrolase n=1 Tax=Dactylosporangium sp. NPDC048998 TaxID=3363976 RepID=UPI003715950B